MGVRKSTIRTTRRITSYSDYYMTCVKLIIVSKRSELVMLVAEQVPDFRCPMSCRYFGDKLVDFSREEEAHSWWTLDIPSKAH